MDRTSPGRSSTAWARGRFPHEGKSSPPHTWKRVKSITFCGAGCVKRVSPRLLKAGRLFKTDTTQTSSSIHTLVAVCNLKYLCGNIIMVQIYWQWQQGIRASLCVPQDERVFLSLAPEVLQGMDCVTSWQQPGRLKLHAGDNKRQADSTRKDEKRMRRRYVEIWQNGSN